MKFVFFIFFFLISSNLFALENISFEIKEPYPVCIQEAKTLEPTLPLSFFETKSERSKSQDISTPCNDYLCNESKKNGFSGLINFFQNDFPKVEQELFAKDLVKSGHLQERLKLLNDTLINCQNRTEELHKVAAQAAGDIYDETDTVDKIPEGYELTNKKTDFFVFPDSDVKAYVLHPKQPNDKNLPPIISFAGTRSLTSAAADLNYGASQVNNVKMKFFLWINSLKAEGQKELIITGHSLGGALAQALSAMIPDPFDMKTHVVTFNGFGGKDALKAYETVYGKQKDIKDRDFNKFQATRDAVGYRMEGDVVSLMGERFGETRTIPTKNFKLQIVANHLMTTIDAQIATNPHALMSASRKDVTPWLRPISFVVQAATVTKSAWDHFVDSFGALFEKECKGPYDPANKKSDKCESPNGDALLCLQSGNTLKADNAQYVQAMQKYKIGCELCHRDSCVQLAVLNKIVGYDTKTLTIAKKACDMGDQPSCIEAGTLVAKKLAPSEESEDKYIFFGCAYGDNNEKTLCPHTVNSEFAMKYIKLSDTACSKVSSIESCELAFLSGSSSQLSTEKKRKRLGIILSKGNVSPEAKDAYGNTPLLNAASTGNVDLVKFFVSKGASLDAKNNAGNSVLQNAVISGNVDLVKFLVGKGVDLDVKFQNGFTPLLDASFRRNVEMIKYLVSKGADLEVRHSNGDNPLLLAAQWKNEDLIKFLVSSGANMEVKNQNGTTPMLMLASSGNVDLIKFLVEKGAKLDVKDLLDDTPLLNATSSGNVELVKYLMEKGANIEVVNQTGQTPLLRAASTGNTELVRLLVERGASIDVKDHSGNTPFFNAIKKGNLDTVKFLVEKGAKLELKDETSNTPLLSAAATRNVEMIKFLVEKGADLKARDRMGNTPLLLAVSSGNEELVKYLVEKGAELDVKNQWESTPLLNAASSGNEDLVKFLISRGANLNAKNKSGNTPLSVASFKGNLDLAKFLVEKGSNIESKNQDNGSPLLLAEASGNAKLVKFLVENGANIEARDQFGDTTLLKAVYRGRDTDLIKFLVEKGANLEVKNRDGVTPLQILVANGNAELVEFLVNRGAKTDYHFIESPNPQVNQIIRGKKDNPFDVTNANQKK